MYLYASLLTLCLSVVSALPIAEIDDNFAFVSDLVESTNVAGELFLEEDHEDIWRRKCEANGGPDAFVTSRHAGFELFQCLQNIVNVTALRSEIAEKRKIGELEEVFPKYCERKDEFVSCFQEFVKTSRGCFEEKEIKRKQVVDDVVEKIAKFLCFRGGNRMAMFIADKGPECIEKNLPEINNCVKASYGGHNITIPVNDEGEISGLSQIKDVPRFAFEPKDCLKLSELQRCTVGVVETCEEATPVNFLDAVFSYVRKSTPCLKLVDPVMRRRHTRSWRRQSPAATLPDEA